MKESDDVYTFPACFRDPEALAILQTICQKNGHSVALLKDLYQVVMKYSGSGRPDGINDEIGSVLDAYGPGDEVL